MEGSQAAVAAESAPTDDHQGEVAAGMGSMQCVYAFVGNEANVDNVAADLRNHAPQILCVVCDDSETALTLEAALTQPAVDRRRRGDGGNQPCGGKGKGKERASTADYQMKFMCVRCDELIIAGRVGFVKEVNHRQTVTTPGRGTLAIADVDFSVTVQQMLQMKVAVLRVRDVPGRAGVCDACHPSHWREVAHELSRMSVRLIAGEFGGSILQLLTNARSILSARACAFEPAFLDNRRQQGILSSSAMVFLGPVESVTTADKPSLDDWPVMEARYRGATDLSGSGLIRGSGVMIPTPPHDHWPRVRKILLGEGKDAAFDGQNDESYGWPIVQTIKEKKPSTVMPQTSKLCIYMGATQQRRSEEAKKHRKRALQERMGKSANRIWSNKQWKRPYNKEA